MQKNSHTSGVLIEILDIALTTCDKLAKLQKMYKTNDVSFKTKYDNSFISINGIFSDKLLASIYTCINKSEEIIFDVKVVQNEVIQINVKTNLKYISYLNLSDKTNQDFDNLCNEIQYSFLPLEKLNKLTDFIKRFIECRNNIKLENTPFPDTNTITKYLESYYKFLVFLMNNNEIIKNHKNILDLLLQLDSTFDGISILHPMSLNALQKIYKAIEEYYNKVVSDNFNNECLYILYKDVIKQKTIDSFSFVFSISNTFERTTTLSYLDCSNSECLKIGYKNINEYSSYVKIEVLRLAEKILYEFEKRKDIESFSVAILGDLEKESLGSLLEYLKKVKGNEYEKTSWKFDFYSNNFGRSMKEINDYGEIYYYPNLDNILKNSNYVKTLLNNYNVVFLLDCNNLYHNLSVYNKIDSIEYFKQIFVFGRFHDLRKCDKLDLFDNNLLDELYEIMMVTDKYGYLGKFRKLSNDIFLKFCEKQIRSIHENNKYVLYVYMFDLQAFNNVYCNDRYFLSTEKHNQKNIGIIRYCNIEQAECVVGEKDKMILCFDIWQIIKHLNFENRKRVIEYISNICGLKEIEQPKDYELHRMRIGINYTKWETKIVLHYAIEDDNSFYSNNEKIVRTAFLKEFIRQVVLPIFNNECNNMFQQYFWDTIYSFLYENVKNVQDMLFIYFLKNKQELLGVFEMAEVNNEQIVLDNYDTNYMYCKKRFYELLIQKYDISGIKTLDQMWVSNAINKNTVGSPNIYFKNMLKACENLNYTKSYLYKNCKEKI